MTICALGALVVALGAGCSDGSDAVDGGSPASDAQPRRDASTDAGTNIDAGSNVDAGPVSCDEHVFEDVTVTMRDSQGIAAFVRRPSDRTCPVPTVLIFTPYNKDNARALWFGSAQAEPLFDRTDYAFVVADWRGRFGSSSATLRDAKQRQEDGYDLVEWIAAQSWSNGNVGMYGASALGRIQYWTAEEQPPHLKAAVPIFAPHNDTYDNYYPGGVLRREYLTALGILFGPGSIITDHPYRDLVWDYAEALHDAANIKTPMLVVSGWFDLHNTGTHTTFNVLRTRSHADVRDQHRLLIGPWFHFASGGEGIWGREFTTEERRWMDHDRRIQLDALAFFEQHLRGQTSTAASWERVRYHQTGEDAWRGSDAWPPASSPLLLFLTPSQTLSTTAPSAGQIDYGYDPTDPSPTIGGQTLSFDYLHGPVDQGQVIARADAVVFASDVLTVPRSIAGRIEASLRVQTTGQDTDFVLRLVDIDENGGHLLLSDAVRRLKLRDSVRSVSPVTPGATYNLLVPFTNDLAYTFPVGHRIGLIVTSASHARFERNPNTGDDFYDQAATPVTVTNTLITDGGSFLRLPELR